MKLTDIIKVAGLEWTGGSEGTGIDITGVYASDLLSDVMRGAHENDLWITLHTHKNIIAVASLKGIAAIININGNKPDAETLEVAREEGIVMFSTRAGMFDTCGIIYQFLNKDAVV